MKIRQTGSARQATGQARAPKIAAMPAGIQAPRKAQVAAHANSSTGISPEEFRQMVANVAYFRAERRGFEAGHELEDWLEAEAEVRSQLGGSAS